MAGQAWDGRLAGKLGVYEPPRALPVHRCDQVADAALKMHRVAAETVVHEERLLVVLFTEEDLRVTGAVRAGRPAGIFFAMALGAAFFDLENVIGFQAHLFWNFAAQMRDELAQVLRVKSGVESHDVAMAFRARDIAVGRFVPVTVGLPDLVTLGAGFSSGVAVVEARAGE